MHCYLQFCVYMYGCMFIFIFCLRILSCNSLYEFIINVLNFYFNRAEYPDLFLPEGQQKGKHKISRPSSNVLWTFLAHAKCLSFHAIVHKE